MPVLLAVEGPNAGVRYVFDFDAEAGRSSACRIRVVDERVSRRHAHFTVDEAAVRVSDLGSRNGTWVNGERIAAPMTLVPGDRVRVGATLLVFEPTLDLVPARFTGGALVVDDSAVSLDEAAAETPAAVAAILELAGRLAEAADEATILTEAVGWTMGALAADVACVVTAGTGGRFAVPGAVAGTRRLVTSRALLAAALEAGKPVRRVVTLAPEAGDGDAAGGRRSVLAVPLPGAGGSLGLLHLERRLEGRRPFDDLHQLRLAAAAGVVASALARVRCARPGAALDPALVGESRAFRALRRAAEAAAPTEAPVLLDGEPGTGRDRLARWLHRASQRAEGPFVPLPAGTLPVADLAAALFGAETADAEGTEQVRVGALERADGGTLYLADLDRLPSRLQARLARALADGSFTREGGRQTVPVGVRLLASRTRPRGGRVGEVHRPLARQVLQVPALPDREGDVALLFDHLAERAGRHLGRTPLTLGAEGRRAAEAWTWPGNVAELDLVVRRLARIRPPGATVGPGDLPGALGAVPGAGPATTLAERVAALEAAEIARVLREEAGHKARTARRLGISRPTLDRKLALYGIPVGPARRE